MYRKNANSLSAIKTTFDCFMNDAVKAVEMGTKAYAKRSRVQGGQIVKLLKAWRKDTVTAESEA
jgi:hypothetical protein